MILTELSTYILANSTTWVAGPSTGVVQVWKGRFPSVAANTSVALFEAGGIEPNYTYSGLNHERPTVQVISRSTSYETARDNANVIYVLLGGTDNATLSSVEYAKVTPSQSPFDIGTDADGRTMISCNYIADKAVSP